MSNSKDTTQTSVEIQNTPENQHAEELTLEEWLEAEQWQLERDALQREDEIEAIESNPEELKRFEEAMGFGAYDEALIDAEFTEQDIIEGLDIDYDDGMEI